MSERWADRSCSTGAFAAFVGARLNMPGAQISGETQLGVWLSQIGELDASDAKLLLQAELGQTFAHANRCFCGAALQRVPSDMTAHSSEVSSKGQSSSAGCVAAQATLRSDVDTTSARGSYPPSSSSAELSCLLPSAPGKTSAADAPSAKSASMVDNGVGDINALSLEQAVVMLLQVDGATSQEVLQSNFSAVFRHASICFCNNAQNEGNKREPSKLRGAGSSVAAPEPGAAALLGAASGAEAESKAISGAAGGKAAAAGAGSLAAAEAVSGKAQSSSGAEAAAACGKPGQASAVASAKAAASATDAPADGARDGGKGGASDEATTRAASAASEASSGAAGETAGGDVAVTGASQRGGSAKAAGAGAGAGSSVAAPEPGAAALLGAASGAEAESKASGVAAGVKATSVDGGMKVEGSPVTPVDFSSAASIGASKSRSCAFCACGVQ